jgi:hypothetical protein
LVQLDILPPTELRTALVLVPHLKSASHSFLVPTELNGAQQHDEQNENDQRNYPTRRHSRQFNLSEVSFGYSVDREPRAN